MRFEINRDPLDFKEYSSSPNKFPTTRPHYLNEKETEWINEEFEYDHTFYDNKKQQHNRINSSSIKLSKDDNIIIIPINFPKEKRKTIISFGFLVFGLILNATSLALVHDRVPDRDKYPPLPDAILDSIHHIPGLMKVPDLIVLVIITVTAIIIILHRHRWIVGRRAFFILSIIYIMRSVTMYLTVLPVANNTVYCSPKLNHTTTSVIFERVYQLVGGGGMQISGHKSICGDYIYSGHTAILMIGCLFIQEYSPKKLFILHWFTYVISWSGIAILLIARGHYSIDVLIGYYAATRMFWTYHSLANNRGMKIKSCTNFHSNVWWFRIFQYLEGNIEYPLPQEYSLPWMF